MRTGIILFAILVSTESYADFCGDGTCGLGETCASCEEDCGQCNKQCSLVHCQGENCDGPICAPNKNYDPECIVDCREANDSCTEECMTLSGNELAECFSACEANNDTCKSQTACQIMDCSADKLDPCGDGLCDEDSGENSVTCPADCGVEVVKLGRCGDGTCGLNRLGATENCENCPADCGGSCECPKDGSGDCSPDNCTLETSLPYKLKMNFDLGDRAFETAKAFGFGARLDLSGGVNTFNHYPAITPEESIDQCVLDLKGAGGIRFCALFGAGVGNIKKCIGGLVSADGYCSAQKTCSASDPRKFSCNKADFCCNSSIASEVSFAHIIGPAIDLGAFKVGVEYGYNFRGGLKASRAQFGLSQGCGFELEGLRPTVTLGGQGLGFGKMTIFGIRIKASAGVDGCATIGLKTQSNDPNQDILDLSSAFRIGLKSVKLAYFNVGGWTKIWTGGDGCVL